MNDKKRDYLIKTLSRTKRKDFENYIINAIFHKLNRLDLCPVTQQYIRRSDGKYALVDLYFPALNYGIECDEAHHIHNRDLDAVRTVTMVEMLNSVEETSNFILRRVRAYEDMESIDSQINNIVLEIQEMINKENPPSWNPYADPTEVALAKREICVEDNLRFDTISNIARCFGRSYTNMQMSYFNIQNGYYLWCPKLAILENGKAKAVADGWVNILADDWESIREYNDGKRAIHDKGRECQRLCFAKSKDVLGRNQYKFIGAFLYSKELSTDTENCYTRQSRRVDLRPWMSIK